MIGRIVIDAVRPRTPDGFAAKAVVGETVHISADIFKDGHDVLAARVRWRPAGSRKKWAETPMTHTGNDRWTATLEPTTLGRHEFVVEAWTDRYATWRHKTVAKLEAGADIGVELQEGDLLLEGARTGAGGDDAGLIDEALASLRDDATEPSSRVFLALHSSIGEMLSGPEGADDLTRTPSHPLWVDRERALVGAWYELFPRSEGGLAGTANRIKDVAAMGFDVLYLPPIHPIGRAYRKGRNNTLTPGPDDPGSPWAIGGAEGGHTAIHPELGTFTDFDFLVHRAHELGMEIALDYALQCSPDHPWVQEHPEWFHHRPDGSIAYAENPPKKYQDIYPINFWPADDADRKALWDACKEILDFWISHGVRIFRVDNPHTKPTAFWEWVIAAVQAEHPDVLFLAEAFTRPKVMAKLAEVGFTQSYTYFTWRTGASELREYVEELASGPTSDYMRPSFWPNTPDILSGPLRGGSPAQFKARLAMAALLVPTYGMYAGYDLCENEPASPSNEEYHESEKYEIKARDWSRPDSLAPFVTTLNEIRRRHPALQRLRNIVFHGSDNDRFLVFSKATADRSDVVLVVVTTDPDNVQDTTLHLDLSALGLPWDRPFDVTDELTGATFRWEGDRPFVRLGGDHGEVAHILHVSGA